MRYLLIFLLVFCFRAKAQTTVVAENTWLDRETQNAIDFAEIAADAPKFHSAFRPYSNQSVVALKDSGLPFVSQAFAVKSASSTIGFSLVRGKRLQLSALPLLELEGGWDATQKNTPYYALGGLLLKANYGARFAAQITGSYVETKAPFYSDTVLQLRPILPEIAPLSSKIGNRYSFATFTGYLSWLSKNKVFTIQAGRDKHFIGDGYRSVLLSDFSPANPYLRFGANVWRLQYQVWYSLLADLSNPPFVQKHIQPKYGAFHYLSYHVSKHLSFGIFENVVWRGSDSLQHRGFEVAYLNPLVFYRPQEFAVGSPDNSFLGANASFNLLHCVKLYAQLGLDEFYLKEIRARNGWWANKQAWQFGAKWINAFGWKGFKLQAEYNQVRPYTYSHGLPSQNYSNAGLALAHPAGANFKEFLVLSSFSKKKLQATADVWYQIQGFDTIAGQDLGADIFKSYTLRSKNYGNFTGQGMRCRSFQAQLTISYLLAVRYHLRVEFGYLHRSLSAQNGYSRQHPYLYLALRSRIWNRYRDY